LYSKTLDTYIFNEKYAKSVTVQTSDNISVSVPELKAVNKSYNSESEGASFDCDASHFLTAGYELKQDSCGFTIAGK
jgi:hypothetical protein